MTAEEQEILVRGSEEHAEYLRYNFGQIKDWVNSFETKLAIMGRPLLFFYITYITVRASVAHALPDIYWLNYSLLGLDTIMLVLQVMGLEGSMSGLLHLADEMRSKNRAKEADTMLRSAKMVQWLMAATAIDIVLQASPYFLVPGEGWVDIRIFTAIYTNILLITRVVAVSIYLFSMARMQHKGPRVISQKEFDARREEADRLRRMELSFYQDHQNLLRQSERQKIERAELEKHLELLMSLRDEAANREEDVRFKLGEMEQEVSRLTQQNRLLQQQVEAAGEAEESASPEGASAGLKQTASGASPAASRKLKQTASGKMPAASPKLKQTASGASGEALQGGDLTVGKPQVKQALIEDGSLLKLSEREIARALNAHPSTVRRALMEYRKENPEAVGEALG